MSARSILPRVTAVLACLLSAPLQAVTLVNQFRGQDTTVQIDSCGLNQISNNRIYGKLRIELIGQSFPCGVIIEVMGNRVRGNLEVEVRNNAIDNGALDIRVQDNPQVGGTLLVRVEGNDIHRKPASDLANLDLLVKVNRNGGNHTLGTRNEVVAYDGDIRIRGNWVKNNLDVEIDENHIVQDLLVRIDENTVNNLFPQILGNLACGRIELQQLSNTVDRQYTPRIGGNRATVSFGSNISLNRVIFVPPTLLDTAITDNHAVLGLFSVRYDQNQADRIVANFSGNGAGGAGTFTLTGNQALQNDYRINGNRYENTLDVSVQGNVVAPNPYEVKDNWSCIGDPNPRFSLQPTPVVTGNRQACTRQSGGHSDSDGLTDDYERMIGTDPNNWDSDFDGLADGWADISPKDGAWNPGEAMGELGDPNNSRGPGLPNVGAAEGLFIRAGEQPNVLCKDIYLEADFMHGDPRDPGDMDHVPSPAAIGLLQQAFRERGIRLHVDTGWQTGFAGADAAPGGEMLPHTPRLPFRDLHHFDFFNFKNGEIRDWNRDGMLEPRHLSSNRKGVFHYVIIGHNYRGNRDSVGYAEPLFHLFPSHQEGDDLFIADANVQARPNTSGTRDQAMAYSLCHELGHNLGLGLTPATHRAAPPQYLSCMSYNRNVVFLWTTYSDGLNGTQDDWPLLRIRPAIDMRFGADRDLAK